MKLFNRIALSTALLAAAPVALADSATLTITGRVLPGTCTLTAAPIDLDPVKASDLTPGADAQIKAGALEFTGCVGVSKAVLPSPARPPMAMPSAGRTPPPPMRPVVCRSRCWPAPPAPLI